MIKQQARQQQEKVFVECKKKEKKSNKTRIF